MLMIAVRLGAMAAPDCCRVDELSNGTQAIASDGMVREKLSGLRSAIGRYAGGAGGGRGLPAGTVALASSRSASAGGIE